MIHNFGRTVNAAGLVVRGGVGSIGFVVRAVEIMLACSYAGNFCLEITVGALVHADASVLAG
jgi:hypothetical protein